MKNKIIITMVFHFTVILLSAQTNEYAYSAGGNGLEFGLSIAASNSGYSYITGFYTSDTLRFSNGNKVYPFNYAYTNIYFAKMDDSGRNIWCKSFSGGANDKSQSIITDKNDNIYICGDFSGRPTDFDPGPGQALVTSISGSDGFIAKYDSAGNFLWVYVVSGLYGEGIMGATVDDKDNVYVIGNISGFGTNFGNEVTDTSFIPIGGLDVFVAKFNAEGIFQWARQIGGSGDERAYSITKDSYGHLYIYGTFSSDSLDVDPGGHVKKIYSTGDDNIFFAKMDTSGMFNWANSIQCNMYQFNEDKQIAADNEGNVIITGNFSGISIDFDPGDQVNLISSNGSTDIFIAKYDPQGNYLFARSIGGGNPDYSNSVAIDNFNNILCTGMFFSKKVDFNPDQDSLILYNKSNSTGMSDQFVAKFNTNGNILWAENFEGKYADIGLSIETDSLDNVYVSGYFVSDTIKVNFLQDTTIVAKNNADGDILSVRLSSGQNYKLSATSIAQNSAKINFSKGRGTKSVVFARQGSGQDDFPAIDGIEFSDSSTFGTGDFISNTPWTNIYNGNADSIVLKGLKPDKSYEIVSLNYVYNGNTPLYYNNINHSNYIKFTTLACAYKETQIDTTICKGDSIYLENDYRKITGVYIDTLKTKEGCDSIVKTNLTVHECVSGFEAFIHDKPIVYPNPFDDYIMIEIENDNYGYSLIYNLLGNKIVQSDSKHIRLNYLDSGLYYIVIYDENNKLLNQKLILKQ